MPYMPNTDPSRRWFAARAFMVQPASLLKNCADTKKPPAPGQLRLAFTNVLRALRTLQCLAADTDARDQMKELKPCLEKTFFTSLKNVKAPFWNAPDLSILIELLDQTCEVFFAVYVEDKKYDLFHDMNEYEYGKFDGQYENAYPLFVKAGLADSIADAIARYGSDAADAVSRIRKKPAYQSALRDLCLQDWRDYHSSNFWDFDESHSLEHFFPKPYKRRKLSPQ